MARSTSDIDVRPGWRKSLEHFVPALHRNKPPAPPPGPRIPLPRANSDWRAFHRQQNANTRKIVIGIGAISLVIVLFALRSFSGSMTAAPEDTKAQAALGSERAREEPKPSRDPPVAVPKESPVVQEAAEEATPKPAVSQAVEEPAEEAQAAPAEPGRLEAAPKPQAAPQAEVVEEESDFPVIARKASAPPQSAPINITATRELQAGDGDAEKPAAPPAPSDGRGSLELTSEPNVTVYEGERRLGQTPLEVRLLPGRHHLRLVDRAKHLEEKRTIDIRAGQATKEELAFGIGTLRVQAPEGTKLFVDSKPAGTAPFEGIPLLEGHYRLKLQLGDQVVEESIEVPAGSAVDYRVRFGEE